MFVELHLIQNFAPSNLNRDDLGAPKGCQFNGVRRARISSQCIKRAIRDGLRTGGLLADDQLGLRTRFSVEVVADLLAERGHPREQAIKLVAHLLSERKLKATAQKGRYRTEYLLFLHSLGIPDFAAFCHEHWEELTQAPPRQKGKAKKEDPGDAALRLLLDRRGAVDIALFGRMIADLPEENVEAAVQAAHAISTHSVETEYDYFSAVEELPRIGTDDATGAAMLENVAFNSACFYRYLNVDVTELLCNLGKDRNDEARARARVALEALLWAALEAVPTGKQHSFAAQNPLSFAFGVVREALPHFG